MSGSLRAVWRGLLCCGMAGFALGAAAADKLVFCAEDRDIRPWITRDGRGLNFELLNRVARQAGLRFEYRQTSWKRCLEDLKQNSVDGAFGASFKAERLEFGAYPGGERADPRKRLNMDRYVLVRPKGARVDWDGKRLSGLKGPVGVQLGYSIADHLRSMGVAVDEGSPGAAELLRKLLAGHVEAVAMLDGEARSLLAEDLRYAALLEIVAQPLVEKPYYLLLSHRFLAARPELAEAIWQGIEQVRESRDYQALEKQ
ncbi:transporter substrate-binding domain-containing protein [Uliginosibacterium flavum]|uniref:Transporter substrate-binding domain-containing protein n=2 Tax=Uliginosibacterium flavum TaxID=1396831 RepID=A0ABV2TME7_9RHOO